MFNRIRNKLHPLAEVDNVYTTMPPPGTIIGEATEEELEEAAKLEIRHVAFMRLQDMNIQFEGSTYKELLADFQEFETDSTTFWIRVSKRLAVPYEWPIRIDYANGPIFIGDHEVFEEEPDEENDKLNDR